MNALRSFPTKAWYSAGWSHEIPAGEPLKRRILGKDIVLFRDPSRKVAAIDALCPHRGADLGIGKVVDGKVQCPFHGWQFNRSGACVLIPSQEPGQKIPRGASVQSYTVVEQQEIIWIWMDDSPPGEIAPPFYDFLDPGYGRGMRRTKDIPVLAAAPFVSVVENAIDNTHPPFIHPGTLAGEPEVVAPQIIKFDPDLRGYWGQLAPEDSIHAEVKGTDGLLGLHRRVMKVTKLDRSRCYFRFDLGGVVFFYDRFLSGHEQVGFVAITPADETHTWFFGEHVRSFAKFPFIDAIIRKWMRKLNGEDIWHVEKLLSSARAHGLKNPVSVPADGPSLAFRRIFFNAIRRESGALDAASRRAKRPEGAALLPDAAAISAVAGRSPLNQAL
ncbi:MAG TPA: aromatic ring-hydroxylating dioxygenase subunit alpha [Allosphingosinicella sp.]|jgi:phenylpropionate dioxygenase-like ring-hydroxylating dioxygenase large terminal subunit